MSAQYKKANKIRMKLLLFIDNEISLKKQKSSYSNQFVKKEHKNCQAEINFEETFCHSFKNETHLISSSDETTYSKSSTTCQSSRISNKSHENYYKNNQKIISDNYFIKQKNEEAIYIINKKYTIKPTKRISSVISVYENEKKNKANPKKYLKKLCNNLKIHKKPKDFKLNKFNNFRAKTKKYVSLEKKLNCRENIKRPSYFLIDTSNKNKIF